jgi:hypothetical protein
MFILLKMFNELKRQRVHLSVLVVSQWFLVFANVEHKFQPFEGPNCIQLGFWHHVTKY